MVCCSRMRIGVLLLLTIVVCGGGVAVPWSKTFAPEDLRVALTGGGKARIEPYRGEEVLRANLSTQQGATLFGEAALFEKTPGKYRATYRLSIQCPPVGRFNDLRLAVLRGDTVLASRPLDLALLPVDGSPTDIPLDFVLERTNDLTPVRCVVRWSNHADLTVLRHHGLTVTRMTEGAVLTGVQVDKLIYKPGAKGTARVSMLNLDAAPATGTLTLTLVNELNDRTVLPPVPVELAAGAAIELAIPFTAPGEWGIRAEAVLKTATGTDTATDYCSVTDNYFAVGIGYSAGPIQTGAQNYTGVPRELRAAYANMLEVFFWAPCDWAKLTSEREEWWSGQTSYHETESGLQKLIKGCHEQGIAVAGYCSQNAAGPEGWEVARRHPEWFHTNLDSSLKGGYNVQHFDNWNNSAWRAERLETKAGSLPWYTLSVDLRKLPPLDYGINQILASYKQYRWDAMRFDGHYHIPGNDEMTTRNMRRLKERVAAAHPELRLGYNFGYGLDFQHGREHEIRETMAGGGLYMQEAIRALRYAKERYTSWRHYAQNELKYAKQIQRMGGYYHCIWDLSGRLAGDEPVPERGLYLFIYGLIAGGHPYYGTHETLPGCDNWGAFLTRWSSMLWDRRLTLVEKPETCFVVTGEKIEWQPFVQERVVSPTRKFIVLHLVTPPASDSIDRTPPPPPKPTGAAAPAMKDPLDELDGLDDLDLALPADEQATPPPWGNTVQVRYTPERGGARVVRAVLVRPEITPYETPLAPKRDGDALTVTVPHPRYWSMLIWELEGQFQEPPPPPAYTEPPDPAKLVVDDAPIATYHDPMKRDVPAQTEDAEYVLLNRSSANIGNHPIADPDSDLSVVQWRQTNHGSDKIGIWWALRLDAGKYRCSIRLKWTDEKEAPTPQKFMMHIIGHEGIRVTSPTYVTPGYPDAPKDARVFSERGKYQYYDLGDIELPQSRLVTFDGYASTAKPGDNALYADRIRIEPIERYTDAKLAELNPVEKPADLRAPNGTAPKKVLQVKGLFWQQYGVERAVPCENAYHINLDYPTLYAYDVVVLTDFNFYGSDYPTRKRLRDFVEDGGRLVVLGGPKTLGYGRMRMTYLEDLLPVTLTGAHEVVRCDPPRRLGPSAATAYPGAPTLFWTHQVTPRPDAVPLAYADAAPVALKRPFGKGVVYVFTGTVLGEPGAGETPFWECASWKELLKRMVLE